jgi:hypothetical protein
MRNDQWHTVTTVLDLLVVIYLLLIKYVCDYVIFVNYDVWLFGRVK